MSAGAGAEPGVDKSRLLGVDALLELLRSHLAQAERWLRDFGPELLLSALLIGVYALLLWGVSRVAFWLFARLAPPDAHPVLRRTLGTLLRLTFLLLVAVSVSGLFPALAGYTPAIFRVYLLLALLYGGWALLRHFLSRQVRLWDLDASLSLLLRNLLRTLWVVVGVYLIFRQFGVDLLPILGGLGVVGLAVGFAAQDILANLISGVTLLLDRPFRIGDWIRVRDYEGEVHGLTLRTTRIYTRDNEYVSIPNKEIAEATVTNLSAGGRLRLNVPLPLAYRERVPDARARLLEVIAAHPRVMTDPAPLVLVREVNETSLELILRFWVSSEDVKGYPVITMELREAAKEALQDAGFAPPYPQRRIEIEPRGTANLKAGEESALHAEH
ncbi:small conductance mechanosensitive channel [Deinococcus reticulitermitis]|uniref:Small conductance mechanosensitive channel n=1 Tax=Deinococcus reticulitermitis TaxID=856736 RepID=A0A1H7BZN4_9DEIO|nr:mechanosensitive ion channel family protein [Deinococcus reticulitermitis]SEJ83113.1 small conductance mechanosensitive channel [Deinococcus reticulitermitis]